MRCASSLPAAPYTQTWYVQPYLTLGLGSTALCSMCCICTAEQKLTFIVLSFHRHYSSSNRASSVFQQREKWKGLLSFSWSSFLFPPRLPTPSSVSNQILSLPQIAGLTLSKLWSGLLVPGSFSLSTSVLQLILRTKFRDGKMQAELVGSWEKLSYMLNYTLSAIK